MRSVECFHLEPNAPGIGGWPGLERARHPHASAGAVVCLPACVGVSSQCPVCVCVCVCVSTRGPLKFNCGLQILYLISCNKACWRNENKLYSSPLSWLTEPSIFDQIGFQFSMAELTWESLYTHSNSNSLSIHWNDIELQLFNHFYSNDHLLP